MTRRMLVNAQNPEELRVAIVEGSILQEFQVEASEQGLSRGNIYRGVVTSLHPSLNAAFVDYGSERNGFLPFHDVVEQAWHHSPKSGRAKVEDVLERGRPLIVQVTKDAVEQKGAGLTTNLSLAGRYLVLTPFDEVRGVSRKVEDEEMRKRLREQAEKLNVPAGAGFIVRTNALEQTKTVLNRDFNALLRLWKKIETESRKGQGPKLLYSDQDIIVRTLRDYLDAAIDEVMIDDEETFERAEEYVRLFMPRTKTRIVRYGDREPLFSRFGLEEQIDRIYERSVPLPSGGGIVIDRTEALVAVDVNSGRSTRAATQEETALNTNLEAANEVARQLRLRDIGGLIVIDFIDMRSRKGRARVERTIRDAMKTDKARSSVGRISSNGLLEVNRQRLHQALDLRTHRACPTCKGTGRIASPEMVGLNLLRRIEARAATTNLEKVRISLHPELADAFQNLRRKEIAALEQEFSIRVEVIASNRLHRPEQEIEWVARAGEKVRVQSQAGEVSASAIPSIVRRGKGERQEPEPAAASAPAK
ncbi:MAG: Rne/Rng family ribonuclease, partial [Thermoanaerobaculia bacterium]